jgi:hypothetical protein
MSKRRSGKGSSIRFLASFENSRRTHIGHPPHLLLGAYLQMQFQLQHQATRISTRQQLEGQVTARIPDSSITVRVRLLIQHLAAFIIMETVSVRMNSLPSKM